MYGLEQYAHEAKNAGITAQLKADKFDEIRDAARELAKAVAALKAAYKERDEATQERRAELTAKLQPLEKEWQDCNFVLNRFVQRAAEGDL